MEVKNTIVCHIITSLDNGGAEGALFRLVTAQWPAHYQHVVISLSVPGVYVGRLQNAGISVHSLSMPSGNVTLSGLIMIVRLLKKIKPDVVQTWMYHSDLVGGLAARLCGIRNIAWGIRHANLDPDKNSSRTLFVVRVCALLSRWVPKRIVSCSRFSAALHQHAGYCSDKFVTIPNGYVLDGLQPDKLSGLSLRKALSLSENVPVLGMVARFDPQKDHNNLIQALGLLKQRGIAFVCLVAGEKITDDNKLLVDAIEKAGIKNQIKLLGARNDIPVIMNALDIHVLSSLGEAFPNVLAEAMLCGTPCVTTDVGDASLIIGKTGWIVPPRNSSALADAIADALEQMRDHQGWLRRQSESRAYIVDNFSLQKMMHAYQRVWEGMLVSQNKGRSA